MAIVAPRIFLSYSTTDEDAVLKLASDLKRAGEFSTRQRDTAWCVGDLEGCDDESEEGVFGWRAA
jgi:hypothetical protein